MRALLVDDEAAARDWLRRLLATFRDIEIVGEAADGLTALTQVAALAPEVVFLDIEMPGLDGLGVARTLSRAGAAAGAPRIVFVTADDSICARRVRRRRGRLPGQTGRCRTPGSVPRAAASSAAATSTGCGRASAIGSPPGGWRSSRAANTTCSIARRSPPIRQTQTRASGKAATRPCCDSLQHRHGNGAIAHVGPSPFV